MRRLTLLRGAQLRLLNFRQFDMSPRGAWETSSIQLSLGHSNMRLFRAQFFSQLYSKSRARFPTSEKCSRCSQRPDITSSGSKERIMVETQKVISYRSAVKCLAIVLCALFLFTSCAVMGKDGLVIMTDPSYKASVFATNKLGFGAPDGLLMNHGKLYLADEGGVALEVWSQQDGMKTLADGKLGTESPEDLVMDSAGDIFFSDDDAGGVFEVDASGKQTLLAGKDKGLYSTEGIALAPDGSILVGDGEEHQVFQITRTGA